MRCSSIAQSSTPCGWLNFMLERCSGRTFFEHLLSLLVGFGVTRTRRFGAKAQVLQSIPATILPHFSSQFLAHPRGYLDTTPTLTIGFGTGQFLTQCGFQFGTQEPLSSWITVPSIVHHTWTFGVVALHQLTNPIQTVACYRRHLACSLSACQQPQYLPLTAFHHVFRFAVTPCHCFSR